MAHVKFVIGEGKHDAAFIARIMQANGYKIQEEIKINNLVPKYLQETIKKMYTNFDFSYKFKDMHRKPIPLYILMKENETNEIAIVFDSDGKDGKKNVTKILEGYINLLDNEFIQDNDIDSVTVILNMDADDQGINERVKKLNEYITESTKNKFNSLSKENVSECPQIGNFENCDYMNIHWGIFVSSDDNGQGAIEELVLPLIEEGHDELNKNVKELINNRDTYTKLGHKEIDTKKAQIGIMGNLEFPGCANQTIILKTKLIDDNKLRDGIYKKIGKFIFDLTTE